ncbi:hypothetical protein ACETIH_19160 [Microvirga arabica]|uniref:Transposase DDE domain-containing protein n=1 Tax=Microvirga arabica TaxID=1128671 RepID=A0ABV6YBZ5_9HYPH
MGGYGSGNHGGRPTVEDSLVLDLNKLIRDQMFRPQCALRGSMAWRGFYSGDVTACIGYEAHMGDESGCARLTYTITSRSSGEKRHHDYWIELVATPQPFGGKRWWWICPTSGRRVAKLYKPDGAETFASRQAYRLTYQSQKENPVDRALERAFKFRRRLGSKDGFDDFIFKPKGMHWTTFKRKLSQVRTAEAVCNALMLATLRRRIR